MSEPISVVDLFAGPGGLAEGFSSVPGMSGPAFRVALSVEKEATAFRTLRLRSFYRQFGVHVPPAYYDYIAGGITIEQLAVAHSSEWAEACRETFQLELGRPETNKVLDPLLDDIARREAGLSVLVGGPPCQAYSLVGRARNKGTAGYVASEDHRHFLYREYIRILQRLRPAVFVMENVKGILSSTVDGDPIFGRVLSDLRSAEQGAGSNLQGALARARHWALQRLEPDPAARKLARAASGHPQRDHGSTDLLFHLQLARSGLAA